jgi:hypothetical protein
MGGGRFCASLHRLEALVAGDGTMLFMRSCVTMFNLLVTSADEHLIDRADGARTGDLRRDRPEE